MAKTGSIAFTQFIPPNGREKIITIDRPVDVFLKSCKIKEAGYKLGAEILSTGHISLTIYNDKDDHAIKVVPNGPGVGDAVDSMIMGFQL